MKEYTPKQLSDMSFGTFAEIVEESLRNPGGVSNVVVRELRRRHQTDVGRLIQLEQTVSVALEEERNGKVSKDLQDSIYMSCFDKLLEEYEKPSLHVFKAVAEEALAAQQLVIDEIRRIK